MSSEKEERLYYKGMVIERGARHCKIIDENDNTLFRTTNVRDAQAYLDLIEENERLRRLIDSRGMAPHRIYLLAADEDKRGRVHSEHVPAKEVVIVAKADDDAVVVRHLADGREEIVDLEELEPIEGGSYLQASEVSAEPVHVVLRYDREAETASLAVFRAADNAEEQYHEWTHSEEGPGTEYFATLTYSEGDVLVYRMETAIED